MSVSQFHTHPRLSVVVDGQFGSCGKGHVAGWLSLPENNLRQSVTVVRVGGPQAGHTVYGPCPFNPASTPEPDTAQCPDCDTNGHPWRFRQIPVAAVTNPDATLVIAAGSEIDLEVLWGEITQLELAGIKVRDRLFIDGSATMLTNEHKYRESAVSLSDRIGSTGKGVGAARADRIMRNAQTVEQAFAFAAPEMWPGRVEDTAPILAYKLAGAGHVIVEGTQGYGLGLHTRFYPQVTSTDCRAIDFLAQAGISPWAFPNLLMRVFMAIRPFPIRVAGNSGPLAGETSWEALGLPPEVTTVTKKTRRVGSWDPDLVAAAVQANGGNRSVVLALMMADQLDPEVAGVTDRGALTEAIDQFIGKVEVDTGGVVGLVGTSPTTICPLVPVRYLY